VVEGKIYPFFHMTRVDTHRSSCSDPNVQQSPKRDPEVKEYIREFIKPSRGHKLVEYDHGQLEVRIAACHSKDPSLIRYVTSPESDMHRDAAADVYKVPSNKVTKDMRTSVKGDFVFAEFYGSYYPQIAKNIWKSVQKMGLEEHLKVEGIYNYAQFESHIKTMERKFWDDRFPVYRKYRTRQFELYKSRGCVEQLTGFRCHGPMSKNNTFNSPIQGDAAHVLLWAMNKLMKRMELLKLKSHICAEVHDSLLIDMDPDEEGIVDKLVTMYAIDKVSQHWDWISVPLVMEKEVSEIDGNWSEMKESSME
jgi:DNA polymerase-1